jgi:NADPH:quinone reductase
MTLICALPDDGTGLVDVPDELSMPDAVALLADGQTAVGLVRAAGLRGADTVPFEVAADGVGSLLVQLARDSGARVVATADGPRKVTLATETGVGIAPASASAPP